MGILHTVETPFPFRANVVGSVSFTCPWCGHDSRFRIFPVHWTVRCRYEGCKRTLAIGVHAATVPNRKRKNREMVVPIDSGPFSRFAPVIERDRHDDPVHYVTEGPATE